MRRALRHAQPHPQALLRGGQAGVPDPEALGHPGAGGRGHQPVRHAPHHGAERPDARGAGVPKKGHGHRLRGGGVPGGPAAGRGGGGGGEAAGRGAGAVPAEAADHPWQGVLRLQVPQHARGRGGGRGGEACQRG